MDLPKELLQKYLPNTNKGTEKGQISIVPKAKAVQSATGKAKKIAKGGVGSAADALSPPDGDEDALFLQAMQGMVRESRKNRSVASHGAFPLEMPTPADTMPESALPPRDMNDTVKTGPQRSQGLATQQLINKNAAIHAGSRIAQGPAARPVSDSESEHDTAFALAMRTVRPLQGKGRDVPPLVEVVDAAAAQSHTLSALVDAEIVFDVHMSGEDVHGQLVGLDPKVLTSLISGSQSPEARLDLHGMNAAQAFQALVPFFKSAWHKGLRTVIVVTGRGINSPTGISVLRQKVSSWLTQEPFKRVVMAFSTAQPCDGGTGSMYVLLRKFRKKHPVYWERSPSDSDIF